MTIASPDQARCRGDRNDLGHPATGVLVGPRAGAHRQVFTLLAVAQPLALEPGATANELKRAAEGKVLAEGTLTRRFRTRRRREPPVDIAAAMLNFEVARRVNA